MSVEINATNFPDAVFRQYVSDHFDTNNDGYLDETEISNAETLVFSSSTSGLTSLSSLAGLSLLPNINHITIQGAENLSDISELSDLTKVSYLHISYCPRITTIDLSGISVSLTSFYYAMRNGNPSNINISGLALCTKLQSIAILNHGLTGTDAPSQQASINSSNALDVSDLSELTHMSCSGFTITGINLEGCSALETLGLSRTNIASLDLTNYAALRTVSCENSLLRAIKVSSLSNLTQLTLNDTNLTELDLSGCTNLTALNISRTGISVLYLLDQQNLQSLWVTSASTLFSIPGLGQNSDLLRLHIGETKLDASSINLNNHPSLKEFVAIRVPTLTSIDIGNSANLLRAYRSGTHVSLPDIEEYYILNEQIDLTVDTSLVIYTTGGSASVLPVITTQPQSVIVPLKENATFSVASSGENLQYQWQTKQSGAWVNISGKTSDSITVNASMADNGRQYRCQVSNAAGTVYSNAATLTVPAQPAPVQNKIYVGSLTNPSFYYENDKIMSINTTQCVSLIGQELSIDTLTATVLEDFDGTHNIKLFRSSDHKIIECADGSIYALDVTSAATPSDIINIPEWTPIWYYQDEALVGKFYTESIKRLSKAQYQLNCVSAIGRIDRMYHGGWLFEVSTFGTVLAHILASGLHGDGAPVIDYYIDDDVAELTVSGWLPYDTKRNNLYQLIFSHGINIIKSPDGSPRFTFVYTNGNSSVPIEDSKIFQGGNVEYGKPYSGVSIMEHTYSDITTDITPTVLYDNTSTTRIENEEIWFDQAPIIVSTLEATEGLTIVSSTVNSAVLTGNGKLTGIPYTHTTRTVSRANSTGDKEKTVSVEQCTMVNTLNSENLLNRLFAFYCPPDYIKKISNELVYNDERCGKQYRFSNPYMEPEDALLSKMELNTTTFNRARCEFYAGYDPVGQQGLYQHCIILDKATFEEDGGVFTVPQELLEMDEPQMRVVMIGGGTGGWSGNPGGAGQDTYTHTYVHQDEDITGIWYGAEGGLGGDGGEGGTPGRVQSVTITNPSASYSYTIGDGGDGGEHSVDTSIRGDDGTPSTFDMYSSDDPDSYVPVAGVYNPIYGDFYALKGKKGISGGHGGARKIGDDENYVWSTDGENVVGPDGTIFHGGRTGSPLSTMDGLPECKFIAYGGNGAGAAVGIDRADHSEMDGKADQEASWEVVENGI